jgi:hypothetical protein
MTADALILGYLVSLLAGLSAVALYYERRRRLFEPTASHDRVFRCVKCALVYTDDSDVDRSRCPQCGVTNDSISF